MICVLQSQLWKYTIPARCTHAHAHTLPTCIQSCTQSHYDHFLWWECCQTIFRSSAAGKTTRGTKREQHKYSQKVQTVCGFILFLPKKWIQNKTHIGTDRSNKHEEDMWIFCYWHRQFVTFDRTKAHLSLGKNFLLIQFESSTDLPSYCRWLLSRIERIFLWKLSCQLLQKTKRTF